MRHIQNYKNTYINLLKKKRYTSFKIYTASHKYRSKTQQHHNWHRTLLSFYTYFITKICQFFTDKWRIQNLKLSRIWTRKEYHMCDEVTYGTSLNILPSNIKQKMIESSTYVCFIYLTNYLNNCFQIPWNTNVQHETHQSHLPIS